MFFDILAWKCASCHSSVQFFDIYPSKTGHVFSIWRWKRASRHSGVPSFDILTSKSGPNPSFLLKHCELEMCLAPQRRAIFRHPNFQKCSGAGVFCAFWLQNVLRTTAVWQFFISHLATWLRTRRFSEPNFRPSRPQKSLEKKKHSVSRLF